MDAQEEELEVVKDPRTTESGVSIKKKRPPISPGHHSKRENKSSMTSISHFNVQAFTTTPSLHQITVETFYAHKNAYKCCNPENGLQLNQAFYKPLHLHTHISQWNENVFYLAHWRLVGDLVNKLTDGNYIDNRGPYIETCQSWILVSLQLCCDEDVIDKFITLQGNTHKIELITHENGAMYNSNT
jgi:hypothetical protein